MGFLKQRLLAREKHVAEGKFPSLTLKEENPIKWEILFTRLAGVVQSSRETARMISASPVVREIGECVFALFTPEGDSVCFSTGLLLHVASIGSSIKWMLMNDYEEIVGIEDGDYFFNNDPYIGGAHSPDQLITTPIFYEGQLIGWSGGLTHVPETGATEPGGMPPAAMSRFDEGLFLPCVKIAHKEEIKVDLEILVERSVRTSTWWLLDNRAKMAGSRMIRDGVKNLIKEYGLDYYLKALNEYIEDTRQACKEKIKTVLFPGTYKSVAFYDVPNGDKPVRFPIDYEIRIPLELKVGPDGSMALDYDGTSPPGFHPNNGSLPCTVANLVSNLIQNLFYDIKYNQGINQGILQAYTLSIPPSCINPQDRTTACSAWATAMIAGSSLTQVLGRSYYCRGFREEISGMPAVTAAMMTGGVDQYGRAFGAFVMEVSCTGMGANALLDGPDTCYAPWNPEGDFGDSEIWEMIVPQMWLGRRIHPDGGGFGKYRGGNGIESLYFIEHTDDIEMGAFMCGDRVFSMPGLMGAYPASANYRYYVVNTDLEEAIENRAPLPASEGDDPSKPQWQSLLQGRTVLTDGQMLSRPFNRHDLFQQLTNSGGGYGDPLERSPHLVREDFSLNRTTLRTAEKVYGVVLDPKSLKVDEEATKRLRERIKEERKKRAVPTREYMQKERARIVTGDLPQVPKRCLNLCIQNSQSFKAEFKTFWSLPGEFNLIP